MARTIGTNRKFKVPIAKGTLRVAPLETTYTLYGDDLKKVLDDIGATQAELARACKFQGASRVCHLVKGGEIAIGESALRKIIDGLESLGAKIDGFYA